MYDTLIAGIKANIDSKRAENNDVFVRGWSFSESQGVCPVRAKYDGSVRSVDIETRPDIVAEFSKNNIILCGWKLTVPTNKYVDLQIKSGGEWSTFISFNTFNVSEVPINPVVTVPFKEINKVEESKPLSDTDIKQIIKNSSSGQNLTIISLSRNPIHLSNIYVVDNFYQCPNDVRQLALQSFNTKDLNKIVKASPEFKTHFEKIIGIKLDNFEKYMDNGAFSYSVAGDKIVFDTKEYQYAGLVFLTPNAPRNTGITLYKSRHTDKLVLDSTDKSDVFKNGNLDCTEFEPVDVISNVYNRLVIFNAKMIHAVTNHFGNNAENGRLVQMFAFDVDATEIEKIQALHKVDANTVKGILKNEMTTEKPHQTKKISFNM